MTATNGNQYLGIDLARRTGTCVIDWASDRQRIVDLRVGTLRDNTIIDLIAGVRSTGGWVAIDAPFGFPSAFTQAVGDWGSARATGVPPLAPKLGTVRPWDPLTRRITDVIVHKRQLAVRKKGAASNSWPLSSVTDMLTPNVIRCAGILTSAEPSTIDRIGYSTRMVECYPVASLRLWGIDDKGYKADDEARSRVLDQLVGHLPALDLGAHRTQLVASDDALDALVCALMARLASRPNRPTDPETTEAAEQRDLIEREGWIHLPPVHGSFAKLSDLAKPASTTTELRGSVGWVGDLNTSRAGRVSTAR